jgi:hypothetical protein
MRLLSTSSEVCRQLQASRPTVQVARQKSVSALTGALPPLLHPRLFAPHRLMPLTHSHLQ